MKNPLHLVAEQAEPATSALQRRQERLRQTIFDNAGKLYEENGGEDGNGFEATTVEAIAARSDISTRTFFRHFESKADVIYLDLRRSTQEFLAALDKRLQNTDPFSAAVLARIDQIANFAAEPMNVKRLLRAMRSRHFVNRRAAWYIELQELIQQRLVAHYPANEAGISQSAIAAAIAVKVGEMGLVHWANAGGAGNPAAAIAQVYLWSQAMFQENRVVESHIAAERILLDQPAAPAQRKGKK